MGVEIIRSSLAVLPIPRDSQMLAIHLTLFADTTQAIIDCDRSPLYRLCGCDPLPGIDIRQTPGHLGLSADLLVAINTIVSPSGHTAACDKGLLASVLEAAPLHSTLRPGDSTVALSVLAMHELWRQATLVLYYTIRLGKGCISSIVQECLGQAAAIAPNMGELKPPIPFWTSASACPWFIFSTVAMREEDRDLCREQLMMAGSGPTYTANLGCIEALWTMMEETGRPVDFRTFIKENNYNLGFL